VLRVSLARLRKGLVVSGEGLGVGGWGLGVRGQICRGLVFGVGI
jgi:hypothetical protein